MRICLLMIFLSISAAAQTIVPVSNTAWAAGLSPYNWFVSGSTFIQAVNPGAYFKVGFSGTSVSVTVDVSAMVSGSVPAKQYPQIAWTIDGGVEQTAQLTSASSVVSLASGLTNSTHSLLFTFYSSDAYTPRWTGEMSAKIDNLIVDTGASLSAATLQSKKMLIYGDSITEGAWILGAYTDLTNYSLYEVGNGSYADQVASDLKCEYGEASFGGQSWMSTFNLDIPPLPSAWNFYFSTNSRLSGGLISPAPDYVLVNMGTNDSGVTPSTVSTWLTSLRTAVGATAQVFVIIPFNQTQAANIATGFLSYKGTSGDGKAWLIDLGTAGVVYSTTQPTYSYDGEHPNAAGHQNLAALVNAAILSDLNMGGGAIGAGASLSGAKVQ